MQHTKNVTVNSQNTINNLKFKNALLTSNYKIILAKIKTPLQYKIQITRFEISFHITHTLTAIRTANQRHESRWIDVSNHWSNYAIVNSYYKTWSYFSWY